SGTFPCTLKRPKGFGAKLATGRGRSARVLPQRQGGYRLGRDGGRCALTQSALALYISSAAAGRADQVQMARPLRILTRTGNLLDGRSRSAANRRRLSSLLQRRARLTKGLSRLPTHRPFNWSTFCPSTVPCIQTSSL